MCGFFGGVFESARRKRDVVGIDRVVVVCVVVGCVWVGCGFKVVCVGMQKKGCRQSVQSGVCCVRG